MEILWWLAPPAAVTLITMITITWLGRPQRETAGVDRSEAAYERFVQAMERDHPGARRPRPAAVHDRSTGIAVRPSRGVPPQVRRPA